MTSTPADHPAPDAPCEASVARVRAAAQNAHLAHQQLHRMNEVLQRVAACVSCVANAHAPSQDAQDESIPQEMKALPLGVSVNRPSATPTSAFWREWAATTEASTVFHRSGLSTSLGASEKAVTHAVVHKCVPRLQRLQEKVQRLKHGLACASRRRLVDHEADALRRQWVVDALTVLSQATRPPASRLWTDLEADYATMLEELTSGGAASALSGKEAAWREGRQQQQQQRVAQLFREVVRGIVGDAPTRSASTEEGS